MTITLSPRRGRVDHLLADLVDQAHTLTEDQRRRLHDAYTANYAAHRLTQFRICDRLRSTPGWAAQMAVRAEVWGYAHDPASGWRGAPCAASDAALAVLAGDVLDPAERRLFDAPWLAVFPAEVAAC